MKNREGIVWWIILVAFLFLLLPVLSRSLAGDPLLAGASSSLHERHAAELRAGIIGVDALRSTPVTPTPHLALIALTQALGVSWVLPAIIVAALLVVFALLLRAHAKGNIVMIAVIVAAISPTVMLAGTRHAPSALALLFSLVAILALRRSWLAATLFALASMTHPLTAIFAGGCAGLIARSWSSRRVAWSMIGIGLFIGLVWTSAWGTDLSTTVFSDAQGSFGLYEFGAPAGLSVFIILAAFYGAFRSRKQLRNIALAAVIVALGLSFPQLSLVATVAIAVLAGTGIDTLLRERWELEPLRDLLLVLFLCAGVFLAITTVRHVTQEQPDAALVDVLRYVGENRRPGGILTDPTYAPIVEWYSGRHAALPDDAPPVLVRAALYTRDPTVVYDLLESTDASFVLLTAEMRAERFSRSDEGILFVLPNTERFVPIRSTAGSTLWYYIDRQATAVNADG